MKIQRTKRRLLAASAGVVAVTALEGIACGNPVAPPMREPPEQMVPPASVDAGATPAPPQTPAQKP